MTIAILGGGLAGLSAGYYLKREGNKNNQTVQLFEANEHTGGWIQSGIDRKTNVVTELGPRTIRGRGKSANNTYNLIKELGIEELVCNVGIDASARYIYAKGNIHQLPMSIWRALFTVNQPFTKPWIYYVLRECFSSYNNDIEAQESTSKDENTYSFFCRTYGQEFADYLISPLLCGVSGGNAKLMSVNFMFSALYEAERKYGSVGIGLLKETLNSIWDCKRLVKSLNNVNFKPPPSVYYLKGGLQRLIYALQTKNESQGVHINLNSQCTGLNFHTSGAKVCFSDGQEFECNHVVSAIPAYKLALLLSASSQHSKLSELLISIPMVSIATVNLSYDDPSIMGPYKGFGVLASPQEKLSLLGIIFNNYIYGHNNRVDLTVMMGGYGFQKHLVRNSKCLSEEELTLIAMNHVKRVLKIQTTPNSHSTHILNDCIPQYTVGHYERVTKIQDYITSKCLPLTNVGSSYFGISINDVISSTMKAMRKLCK